MGHTKRKQNPQLKARTTRSSRGRLLSLSDPAQTSQQLDDQLRRLGLYAAPTLGDGNCLFRALSDQLYGTDSKHTQLRQDICDWIQTHKGRYEPFVDDERGIDTHLRCMRENATYGGHMELSAFAHMARRNVKVVQPGLVYVIEWQAFVVSQSPAADTSGCPFPPFPDKENRHQEGDDADSTIYVAYHDWEHFSSIRSLKGPHAGLPRVTERPVSSADVTTYPTAEDYVPTKERKKDQRERERERKERKREKARNKTKHYKGKQRDTDTEDTDEETPEHDVSPEKLKIKLKLTLNDNPSSANISEFESNNLQKTGFKLRLPPSRSLSVTPSTASTPPQSQASSTSVASCISSTSTLPTTTIVPPTSSPSSTSTAADYVSTYAELPHAQPPSYTAAPHLTNSPSSSSSSIPQRINRSPKRTFEETQLEDVDLLGGRGQPRSRLRGPDKDDSSILKQCRGVSVNSTAVDHSRSEKGTSEEREAENLVSGPSAPPSQDASAIANNNDDYESDISLTSSLSSLTRDEEDDNDNQSFNCSPPGSRRHRMDRSPAPTSPPSTHAPTTSASSLSSSSSTTHPPATPSYSHPHQTTTAITIAPSTPYPNLRNRSVPTTPQTSPMTRSKSRQVALPSPATTISTRLTRRERKKLGLPKVRAKGVGPYDRHHHGTPPAPGDTVTAAKGGSEKDEEWKRNGTGRVDVRGFRELKI